MQSLGIASLIALTKALAGSATVVSNVMADKKVDYKDAVHIPSALGVVADFAGVDFETVLPEMKDLTGEEQDALAKQFRESFQIENKSKEATIEEGFSMLLQGFEAVRILLALGDKIQGIFSGKYKPDSQAQGSQSGQGSSSTQGQSPVQGQIPEEQFDNDVGVTPPTTDAGVPYTPPAEEPVSNIPPESPVTGNQVGQQPLGGPVSQDQGTPSNGQAPTVNNGQAGVPIDSSIGFPDTGVPSQTTVTADELQVAQNASQASNANLGNSKNTIVNGQGQADRSKKK